MQTSAPISLVPTTERPEHKMAAHIRDAAEATGVPFDFLLAQANQESRLNPDAKNQRSSAMGLFQFTAGTWMDMVKKHGAEHGLEQYADAITKGADGRWTVTDKALKKEILELRRDPKMSALMAGEYAKDNEKVLESKLGRQVSTHDLYLAHFLGAGGALKVLKGRDQELLAQADTEHPPELAGAAKANPEVFQDPASGEARSLDAIYNTVEKRFKRAMGEATRMAEQLNPRVDLAALRPESRPDMNEIAAAIEPEEPAPEGTTTMAAAPIQEAAAALAMTMADIPSTTSTFPARLPPASPLQPAAATGIFPAAISGQGGLGANSYPVALPPPLTGSRADADTLRSLVAMIEDKG